MLCGCMAVVIMLHRFAGVRSTGAFVFLLRPLSGSVVERQQSGRPLSAVVDDAIFVKHEDWGYLKNLLMATSVRIS